MPHDDFKPSNALSLHDAMMRVGKEIMAGWDADAVAMLREVFASTPHCWADLSLINERWPDRTTMPEELAQLIAAVWGPGGEEGDTPSAVEYQTAVDTAAARWPNAQHPAKAQLETVGKQMRQWIGDGAIKLFRYGEDGREIALGAELARAANQTTFDAMLLDGVAPATEEEWEAVKKAADKRKRLASRKIWVRVAELETLFPQSEPTQIAGKRLSKEPTKVEAIAGLIRVIWPNGVPVGLKARERDNIILKAMKTEGFSSACPRTIGKAVKLAKSRNA